MLKIKDNVDLKELEKFGFKQVQQNKNNNYIFYAEKFADSNCIIVKGDMNLFSLGYHIGEDRQMSFKFNTNSLNFNRTLSVLYELIKADLVEKVRNENE